MLVPVLIFLAGVSGGVVAAARWVPDLASGQVGGLAFFVVCGLLGAAAGLVGLHVYSVVEVLNHFHGGIVGERGEIIAQGLRSSVFEAGSLLGFAAVVYLLAPDPDM